MAECISPISAVARITFTTGLIRRRCFRRKEGTSKRELVSCSLRGVEWKPPPVPAGHSGRPVLHVLDGGRELDRLLGTRLQDPGRCRRLQLTVDGS